MDYAKYIKYKNKYLNLKNQKGGSDFYLPCDITHYTSNIYYSYNNKFVSKYINNSIDIIRDRKYIQDIYTQLYNGVSYKTIVTDDMYIYIYSLIYTTKTICNNDICECKCKNIMHCFNKNDEIRGCFCNKEQQKNIKSIETRINNTFSNDECIKIEKTEELNFPNITIEQSKGGNYISAPNNTIFYVDGTCIIINEILKINNKLNCVELKCSFKSLENTFRHIDELMCFMPYGKNTYKIWFYDIFTNIHFNNKYSKEKIDELNIERLQNLNKISQALFEESFENSCDNFVFFDYYIWTQSIFNRTWYEDCDKCICLFPKLTSNTTSVENTILLDNINKKINIEMLKVCSYINNQSPKVHFVDVNDAKDDAPEGTLHCMIKQRFIKVK